MTTRKRARRSKDPAGPGGNEFDAELGFHLASRAADLEASGLTPAEAREQALREFGDVDDARAYIGHIDDRIAIRRERRFRMTGLAQDLRYACRRLLRSPAFSLAVVLTFALGTGANAAIFSVVHGVLLQPLGFPNPDRLYAVYSANASADAWHASVSPVDLDDWRGRRSVIEDLGGYLFSDGATGIDLTGRGEPRRLSAVFISPGFLSTLEVRAEAGRLPREDELVRGGHDRVVLLTDGFWSRAFGREPSVVGTALTLNGEPYTVIGVLPPTLQFPTEHADVYLPLSTIPDSGIPRLRAVRILDVVARAKPGVSGAQVLAEMKVITAGLAKEFQDDRAWGNASVEPLAGTIVAPVATSLWVLFGAVLFVMMLACVNVATLHLARSAGQARDLAVSAALGAGRTRLVRQLLTEGLLLALTGGAVGLGIAAAAVPALVRLAADSLPRASGARLDWTVVAFAIGAATVAGLASSLIPALYVTGRGANTLIRDAGRGVAGSDPRRLRGALVVLEIAFAMMLAVGAGLMGRTFTALLHVDPGFRADHLIAEVFTIDEARHPIPVAGPNGEPASGSWFYSQVIDGVRALPGVVSAAAVRDAPFRGNGERTGFRVYGEPIPPGHDPPTARAIHVSDGYFTTIGAHLRGGREFTRNDRAGTPLVVVVNAAFAKRYFPGRNVVGQRLMMGPSRTAEIVGVIDDISQTSLSDPAAPTVYFDNLQNTRVKTTIVARVSGDPALMAGAIRQVIWAMDPEQPITDVFTFDQALGQSLAIPRLLVVLLAGFGVLGVALGVVGIYGLLASSVSRQRKEIGVRLALGASTRSVTTLVLRRGIAVSIVGIAAGVLGALALTRFLSAVLFGVSPFDGPTFVAVGLFLFTAAVLASWLPARRAAAIDPATALRTP